MVLVPAGAFTMGSPEGEGNTDEHPQHMVDLDAFYIDQYEVTVERYSRFLSHTQRETPKHRGAQMDRSRDAKKPVVGIHWDDAQAYCEWAGKRLPTEAEWEKAARGMDGRKYPWGNSPPDSSRANFDRDASSWRTDLYSKRLKPVGNYEAGKSPYGAYDMAGNVWEWVGDWYDKNYYKNSSKKNPRGPSNGDSRVIRGGSWLNNPVSIRSANRHWLEPTIGNPTIGVRCAQDAP